MAGNLRSIEAEGWRTWRLSSRIFLQLFFVSVRLFISWGNVFTSGSVWLIVKE